MSFQSDTSAGGYGDDLSDDEIDRRMTAAGITPKVPDAVSPAAPPSLAVQSAAPAGPQLPALPPPTVAGSAFDPAAPVIPAAPATSSLPALPPPTPAPTQPTAAPSIPTTDPSASTPTANPAKPAADSSLADIQAMIGGGSDDDAADDARSQYQSDETATNKYLRSQSAQMQVTPTGQTQPATDAQGNVLYKGAVIQPFTRLDDGNAYRVSRDQYGTQHYFDLSQGVDGQDYKTDPQTGDKYVTVSGADGGSKQEIIGQDPIVPVTNATKTLMQSHQDAREQAGQAVDQAQNGVAGAPGYSSAPLATLKQQRDAVGDALDQAQSYADSVDGYIKGGGTLSPDQLTALRSAQTTLDQQGPTAQALDSEIGTRQNTITAARQQRDASTSAFQEATYLKNRLSTPDGQTQVRADLGQVLAGGNIDPRRQAQYVSVGLLQPTQGQNGSQGFALSEQGQAVLSGQSRSPRQPQPATTAPAAASDLAQTTPASPQASSLPGSDSTSSTPATGQDSPVPSTATGAASPLVPGTTGASAQPTADPQNAQGAAGTPAAVQAPKPYSVGQDGSVKFDPANATASVLAAFKDGAIDGKTAEASLSNAKRVEAAHGDVASFLEAHPQIASAAQGLSTGGAFWAGGKLATLGATASGLNPAIAAGSVELGPFAWVPPAVAGAAEFIGGGTLAAWAKNKAENRLAEYSDAVKALQSGAKANPGTNTLANIAGGGLEGLSSLKNLASLGSLAAEGLGAGASTAEKIAAGATAIGKQAAAGAAGGAAVEGLVRPAVGYATDKALDAAGIQHDPTQAPTLGSIAQTAGLGAVLAGHGLEFGDYSANQLGSILNRGMAHMDANVPMHEAVPTDTLAAKYGNNSNVDSQSLTDFGKPLTPAEQEVFFKAQSKLQQLHQEGKIDLSQPYEGTARQATRAGASMDATAVDFRQTGSADGAAPSGGTPSTNQPPLLGGYTPEFPDSSQSPSTAPAVAPTPAAPAPAAARAFPVPVGAISPGSPSPTATNPPGAGQASSPEQPDDKANADTLAALTHTRDDNQLLLDRGLIAPEAQESTRGLVAHLSDQIAALSAPPPATPTTAPVSGDQTASDPAGSSPATRADTLPSPQSSGPVPATAGASGSDPSQLAPKSAPSVAAPPASVSQGSGNDEGKTETSSQDTTAPADRHEAMAAMVNGGATSDHGTEPPSTAFNILQRIKATGAEITPDVARSVSERTAAVLTDPATDRGAKQSALRQIVSDHAPAPSVEGQPELAASPAGKESSLSNPATNLKPGAESFQSPTAQEPSARQPVTTGGKEAAKIISLLAEKQAAGTTLNKHQQRGLEEAHNSLARDLNGQALGPNPQPTTAKGQSALRTIQALENFRATPGKKLQPGDYDTLRASHRALQADFTAQRQAIEAKGDTQPLAHSPASIPGIEHPAPVPAPTRPRIVAPAEAGGDAPVVRAAREWLADQHTAGKFPSAYQMSSELKLPLATARQLMMDQSDAENRVAAARSQPATPSSAGPVASQEKSAAAAIFKKGDAVTYQGRPAIVEQANGEKATIRVKGGPDPKTGANLIAKRVRDVALSKLEKPPAATGPAAVEQPAGPSFKRPSLANVAKQTRMVRQLEAAANGNPDNADVVARHQNEAKTLADMQRQRAMPLQPGETPRSFKMPTAQGEEDVLDHVRNAGGLVSPNDAKLKPTYDPRQGDYDGAPTLGGFYHHAVYKSGGGMMPDRMAAILHENHGIGDGGVDGMWDAVGKAVDTRRAVATQMREHALAEKQANRFEKDTSTPRKGTTEINVNTLNVGDHVEIGGQTLKVAAVDSDTLDVTLEDHSKYGVQQVADGQALYVEKVQPAGGGDSLAAARPDDATGRLFGADEPFELRGETGTDAERVATARELAKRPGTLPQLRTGEKGTADLFQGADQPFNLAGETGIDHGARQQAQAQRERDTAAAQARQDRDQSTLFAPLPERGPITAEQAETLARQQVDANAEHLRNLGVRRTVYGTSAAPSGVSIGSEGTMRIDPAKLAHSLATVRDNQAKGEGIEGTPHDWFEQVLHHESFHGVGDQVAKAQGFVDVHGNADREGFYNSLPDNALPKDFDEKGRETYGKEWDGLPGWAKKAEFVRMFLEGKYFGRVTEALYKFLRPIVDYFKQMAAGEGASEGFKEFVRPMEARIEAARPERIVTARRTEPMTVEGRTGSQITIPPESDRQAAVREWLADERREGRQPTLRDIAVGKDINDHVARRILADQRQAEAAHARRQEATTRENRLAAPEPGNLSQGSERTPDPSRATTIKDLVDEALQPGTGMERKRYALLGTVDSEQAAQLQTDTGLNLEGYRRNLDNSAVRHVWNEHGDPAAEIARGNAPVNREDFERLPQLLEHPDASILAGKNRLGQDIILSAKRVNGYYIIAEEVRGNRVLSLTTLYKKVAHPPANDATQGATPLSTAEPLRSIARRILQQAAGLRNLPEDGGSNTEGNTLATAEPKAEKAPTTYEGVQGAKINRLRTAFSPDADTLGIARADMPQVAAEHRGALANFLQARGIGWRNDDVLPGSLKPSQADYNPGKVEKARQWVGDSDRRILVSSDDHVIDGHHQWMGRLAGHPGEPMPVVRLNAPARDILSQVHEFPSAGMEKAPDLGPRISTPRRTTPMTVEGSTGSMLTIPPETDKQAAVREWIADERQAGRQPTLRELVYDKKTNPHVARRILADQAQAEQRAAPEPDALGAAAPEPFMPSGETAARANTGYSGLIDRMKGKLAAHNRQSTLEDAISAHHDAVDTMAGNDARHARNSIQQLDIPDALDRQAAGAAVEAGYDPRVLREDLAKVQASPNKKLAAKYAPIYQRAIDNLPRLRTATEGYRQMDAEQDSLAERAGLTPSWQARTKHIYNDPAAPESTLPIDQGFGSTPGFKKAADAIAAGVDPRSIDLGELAGSRVYRNQRAINEKAFQDGLSTVTASDGKPLVEAIKENSSALNADGTTSHTVRVPAGYKAVQAGDNVLVAHKEIARLLDALYGEDDWQNHFLGKHLLDLTALIKHGAIGIDLYHGFQTTTRSVLGFGIGPGGWKDARAGYDFADKDLDRAVQAGKITQAQADDARENRRIDEGLAAEGLNTGKASDNLLEAARQANLIEHIPVFGHAAKAVAELTFHRVQPIFMRQAARVAYARNKAANPQMSEQELFRKSSRETNEFYGNQGTQGFLKSKNMQNAARAVLFAPQFAFGRLKSELRGIGQAGKAVFDGVRGRGWRVGVVARALGGIVLANLIGTQMLNLFTRGHTTFQNPEDDHKLDAWIPGGPHNKGFFFSPLSIAAEYSHALLKYMDHRESAVDALAHITGNKLSGGARALKTLATGQNYAGQPFASMAERLKAAAGEMLPLPMQASPWITKNPKGTLGLSFGHGEKGSLEKQLLATAGLRVDAADSARNQMYALAEPFRSQQQPAGAHPPSAYADLRKALDNEDEDGARAEVQRLVTKGGKTLNDIAYHGVGLKDGKVHPELFTGSREREKQMVATFTPAQAQVWRHALTDRATDAHLLAHVLATMPTEQRRQVQLASAANARGNKGLSQTLGRSSAAAPAPTFQAQVGAPPTLPKFTGLPQAPTAGLFTGLSKPAGNP